MRPCHCEQHGLNFTRMIDVRVGLPICERFAWPDIAVTGRNGPHAGRPASNDISLGIAEVDAVLRIGAEFTSGEMKRRGIGFALSQRVPADHRSSVREHAEHVEQWFSEGLRLISDHAPASPNGRTDRKNRL